MRVRKINFHHENQKRMTPAHKELLQEFQDFAKIAPTAHSFMERMAGAFTRK